MGTCTRAYNNIKECEYMLELEENKQRIQAIKKKLKSIGDSL